MPSSKQIRAARALLGWYASDLAERVGVRTETISDIETNRSKPRAETMEKIAGVFDTHGIRFFENDGVAFKGTDIATIEGEGANKKLLDDIFETLKEKGGEVLIANVDESKSIKHLTKAELDKHLSRLEGANITERLLIREGDTNLIAAPECYHAIPKKFFSPYQFYIYGSKLALMTRIPVPKMVIINDSRFSDCVRKLFDYVWEQTASPVSSKDG